MVTSLSAAHPFTPAHLAEAMRWVTDDPRGTNEALVQRALAKAVETIDVGLCPRCQDPLPTGNVLPAGSRVTQCRCVPICGRCGEVEALDPTDPIGWPREVTDGSAVAALTWSPGKLEEYRPIVSRPGAAATFWAMNPGTRELVLRLLGNPTEQDWRELAVRPPGLAQWLFSLPGYASSSDDDADRDTSDRADEGTDSTLRQPHGAFVDRALDEFRQAGVENVTWPQVHARAWELQEADDQAPGPDSA